jgi:hypothetical protein
MRRDHNHASVADARGVFTAGVNRAVQRSRFPDNHVIANDQGRVLTIVLEMLRRQANIGGGADRALLTNGGVPMDMGMLVDDRARTQLNAGFDDAVSPDGDILSKLGTPINKGGRMNL